MKIWILSVEIANAPMANAMVFATEAEAYAAFREEIVNVWDEHFPGDTMPEDTDEAWEMIRDTDWNNDHVWITESEFTLPPVYEAGPALLSALKAADDFLEGWYDAEDQEGMSELQAEVKAAMAKAEGKTPPGGGFTVNSELLSALYEIKDSLDPEATGNAELYADIFEIIDKAVAKAEGRA